MNILFSEGASTSARQSALALGPLGHHVDLLDPQGLCLARFSRYVRAWHRCPSFTRQPADYLAFLVDRLQRTRYDALLAVHDQVFLLSRYRDDLAHLVGLAVPEFAAVEMLQSKVRFAELLDRLRLPQPAYRVLESLGDLKQHAEFPCYVKREFGTAGRGVWRVETPQQIYALVEELAEHGGSPRYLVQQPAQGQYSVVQAVFQHGRLVASHCYTLRARGVGGSAHARESVLHPGAVADVATLGTALDWHGALHMEYFVDAAGRRQCLEANPRIGETINATLAGVNLCEALVRVSLGEDVSPRPASRPGVRTHSLMMSLLGAAERGADRRALIAELARAWQQEGVYAHSRDELTRLDEDPWSLIPLLAVAARVLLRPDCAEAIIRAAVDNYALDEDAIGQVLALPASLLCDATGPILDRPGMPLPAAVSAPHAPMAGPPQPPMP